MVFKPVNRHILVDYIPPESKPQSGILCLMIMSPQLKII